MRVLILEDSPERTVKFKQLLIGHVWEIVATAQEAIQRLAQESWDLLSLDHDLGGEEMVASGPGTGWEVAKWLSEHPDRVPTRIILHSFNAPGRKNMADTLAGYNVEEAPGWWTGHP